MKALAILFVVLISMVWVSPGHVSADTTMISPPAQTLGIAHGVYIHATYEYGQEIVQFNNLVGKNIAVVMYFTDWSNTYNRLTGEFFDPWLPDSLLNALGENSPDIMLSWQPMNGRKFLGTRPACDQNYDGAIPLDAIIAGNCDPYIVGFANALKQRPERFLLRFAHEMNISDSPWWPGHYGQNAAKYVEMWQHVYEIFNAQQVSNVEWVWSPNYDSYPDVAWNNLHNYYPGDSYVDWIGLSGYNWYTSRGTPWMSFSYLYDDVLNDLACHYAKPQLIAEIGSIDGGPGKASWISDTYQHIPEYPFLRGVFWFNDFAYGDPNNADFRVTTGTQISGGVNPLPGITDAYKQAVSNAVYKSELPSLDRATPPFKYCGNGDQIYTVTPELALIQPGDQSTHVLTGFMYSTPQPLSLDLPAGSPFAGSTISKDELEPPWGQASITLISENSTPLDNYVITVNIGEHTLDIDVIVTDSISRINLPIVTHNPP